MELLHLLLSAFRWESARSRNAAIPPPGASESEVRAWARFRRRQADFEAAGMAAFVANVLLLTGFAILAINGSVPRWADNATFWTSVGLTLPVVAFAAIARGRSPFWGFLGLLWFIGLFLIGSMGRKCVRCRTLNEDEDIACSKCGGPV